MVPFSGMAPNGAQKMPGIKSGLQLNGLYAREYALSPVLSLLSSIYLFLLTKGVKKSAVIHTDIRS